MEEKFNIAQKEKEQEKNPQKLRNKLNKQYPRST